MTTEQAIGFLVDHWAGIVAILLAIYGWLSTRYAWANGAVAKTLVDAVEKTNAQQVKTYMSAAERAMTPRAKLALENMLAYINPGPSPKWWQVLAQQLIPLIVQRITRKAGVT